MGIQEGESRPGESRPGGRFNKHDGRPTGRRTILQWTNNMGGWSVARSDSPSCLLKRPPGRQFCRTRGRHARPRLKLMMYR